MISGEMLTIIVLAIVSVVMISLYATQCGPKPKSNFLPMQQRRSVQLYRERYSTPRYTRQEFYLDPIVAHDAESKKKGYHTLGSAPGY